nr:hypothetical protein [Snodgrassella communis]
MAKQVAADIFIIATDVSAAFVNWGKPNQQAIKEAHPDTLEKMGFAAGSMGPKVQAAINFARENPGKSAVIGSLADIDDIVKGIAGTKINTSFSTELTYY